jgi:hypothetical protein
MLPSNCTVEMGHTVTGVHQCVCFSKIRLGLWQLLDNNNNSIFLIDKRAKRENNTSSEKRRTNTRLERRKADSPLWGDGAIDVPEIWCQPVLEVGQTFFFCLHIVLSVVLLGL